MTTPEATSPATVGAIGKGRTLPASLFDSRRASLTFVTVVFVTTVVQVLAVPIAALADGRGEWVLPVPLVLTFTLLVIGSAAQACALLLNRRWPWLALIGTTVIFLALAIGLGVPTWLRGMYLVMALAHFLFAQHASIAQSLLWFFGIVAATTLTLCVWLLSIGTDPSIAGGFVVGEGVSYIAPAAGATALGIWWATQTRRMLDARERAELARQDYDRRVRQAQEAERARIAQELHDVAGQHLAGLVTLADAAAKMAPAHRDETLRLIEDVRLEGRFAAASLTSALADMRASGTEPRETTPDLRRAQELVDYWQRLGVDVSLVVKGDVEDLPAVVSTTGYRVLQEALTNAAKHALGAVVRAEVDIVESGLSVRVRNSAGVSTADPQSGLGLGWGIPGLRERAALLKGTVDAGSTADGGWRVHVTIPTTSPLK